MRRAAIALISAFLVLGPPARSAIAAADRLAITTVVANHQAGTLFTVHVEARDGSGVVDTGFTGDITLSAAASGGANFTTGNVVTAVAGVATFSVFLNNAANGYTITATSPGMASGASNVFNVTATHLAIGSVPNVRSGDPFNVGVEARDANNARAENFTGGVALDATAAGGSNFVGGTVNVAASAGTANVFGLMINNAANGYAITASSSGVTSGVSNSFNVTARRLMITTTVANHQAGSPFNVNVEARDNTGAVAENFNANVVLSATATFGTTFVGGNRTVAAGAGTAAFTGLALNDAANSYIVIATSPGVIGATSNSFHVTATHLAILAAPDVRAGDPFNVTVEARDANNARAENYAGGVSVDAAATGGSNFAGGTANVPAATAGAANFVGLVLNNAADGYTMTASSSGLASGSSNSFNVTARQLVTTTVVANMQAGTPFNVQVEARDGDNALAENFNGSVSLDAAATVGGSNFNGGTQTTAATGGTADFTHVALNDAADNYAITASATGLITGVSNIFNVTATHLAVLAVPNVRAGDPLNAAVEARDANNAVAENFVGAVDLDAAATGGSNLVGGTVTAPAATAGTASFAGLVLNNAADGYTLTASAAGVADGVSNSFNVTARQLVVANVVANMRAGTTFSVQVEARDGNDAPAENFNGSVALDAAALSGGSNFNGGTQTTPAIGGQATAVVALSNAADNYTITASTAGLSNAVSNTFNVTAAHLAVLAVPNVRAGDPFDVTVEARDADNAIAENFTGGVDLDATASGGSNFVGGTANVQSAAAGTATFADVVLNNSADGYAITASSSGLTSGVSNSFDVTARQLVVTTVVANMQAGAPFDVQVEARDGNNAQAENFNGSVALDAAATVGGSNFSGGTRSADAEAGAAEFVALMLDDEADNYTITASASGLIPGASNAFNVSPAGADISIDDVDVTEGNAGTTSATFTVSLSHASTSVVSVDFTVAGSSATSGSDFEGGSGTITFAPGMTSQTISVSIKGDVINESDETFTVDLSGAVNGTLVDSSGVGTIHNDDPVPTVSVQPLALAVEGSFQPRTASLIVRLSAPSDQTVIVTFQTTDGTAVDGVGETSPDYVAATGIVTFAPGETQRTITIALRNDLMSEPDEIFFVDLGTPVNASVGRARARVVIVDDDSPGRQLLALGGQVLALDLGPFQTAHLLSKLQLNCGTLNAFTRQVTQWNHAPIPPAEANALTAAANRLRADIGCKP